jgi:hypothetical protein
MHVPYYGRTLQDSQSQGGRTAMRIKSIYCECGCKLGDFIAEELAEPATDEVWREYVFWRDYVERKNKAATGD